MSKNQIEAYNYYKKLYPTALLLFRVANNYVALCEDAIKMASSLSLTPIYDDIPKISFSSQCLENISRLADDGYEIRTIAVRNDENVFDFPDIQRLEEENHQIIDKNLLTR